MNTVEDFDKLPDSALVRLPIVQKVLPYSRTTIWRWVKNGTLPAPLKMPGSHCVAWRVGDIRRVLASIGQRA
jgi:predicted DNA-binding transcriptional regulator AlpA